MSWLDSVKMFWRGPAPYMFEYILFVIQRETRVCEVTWKVNTRAEATEIFEFLTGQYESDDYEIHYCLKVAVE